MASGDIIVARYQNDLRFAFLDGIRRVREDIPRDANIPVDTGKLRQGIRSNIANSTGTFMTAIVKSTATDGGTDYPAILEHLPRIAPTKAKYLRFEVGGQTVFSKGFDNVHYQWWTRLWADGEFWYSRIEAAICARRF